MSQGGDEGCGGGREATMKMRLPQRQGQGSLSVEEAAAIGPPPPRANELPGPALWHQPSWLQASKPVTFLFYLHMVFASFDVDSYTHGRRDFSKNSLLSCSTPATL